MTAVANGDATMDSSISGEFTEIGALPSMDSSLPVEPEVENAMFLYQLEEVPPWHICILSGFQHFLQAFICTIPLPNLIANAMCIPQTHMVRSLLLATMMFGSGIATVLQASIGIRLPVIQGVTFSYFIATMAILHLPVWQCPVVNETLAMQFPEMYDGVWMLRMREIQGAVIASAVILAAISLLGITELLARLITPMTVLTTNTLIGLSTLEATITYSEANWLICGIAVILFIVFSQYLKDINFPFPWYVKGKGCTVVRYPIFTVFAVLLTLLIMWAVCHMITVTDLLPYGDRTRTDFRSSIVDSSPWFRVPYPCQWGVPTYSVASVIGMLAAVGAVYIDLIGNYRVCADLIGIPPPPIHAINRGMFCEAIGCIITGLLGTGNGSTTLSQNMGTITLTRVASRHVIHVAAAWMIVLSVITKFSAIFTTIPDPLMGATFFLSATMIIGMGIHNAHCINLFSSRNIFIIGFSLFLGTVTPVVVTKPDAIKTGSDTVNQFLTVLLSTGMLIGGLAAAFLDNTIPGTSLKTPHLGQREAEKNHPSYDIPFCMAYLRKWTFTRFFPICPTYKPPKFPSKSCSC